MTANQAKNTTIYFVGTNYEVVSDNLYDFVMASAEMTTSPRGVENKMFIEPLETLTSISPYEKVDGWEFEVRMWQPGGRSRLVDTLETEEEADDFIFQRTEEFDFETDINRGDTSYFFTEYEAIKYAIELFSDLENVEPEVAASILSKMYRVAEFRADRKAHSLAKAKMEQDEREARWKAIAPAYAVLIEPMDGEKFSATASRLSAAIGDRIEKGLFFEAVKMVRHGK